jgi:hypothetical protein
VTGTHYGNDQMGAPTLHRGRLENCPAPDRQDILTDQAEEDTTPYCTGDRCGDCEAPDPGDTYGETDCCEATCGCCPRVNEHGNCALAPGSEDNSKYCDQHGEGWLSPLNERAQRMYDVLRNA